MKGLAGNWKQIKQQFNKQRKQNSDANQEDIDSYTRKLLNKNMKELDKYPGVQQPLCIFR